VSGIFGILHLDGRPADPSVLQRMSARLAHRGPDGAAIWNHEATGLGHRMLHTTPESLRERQPMLVAGGRFALTADARVDNRDELMATLGLRRTDATQPTDAEIILAAYERWGEECVSRIIGDFAFALWDSTRQALFCGRDPMGIKPFYYYRSNDVFVFASEIKGLLSVQAVPQRLNELQLAYFLESKFDDTEITFYDGILRLRAGHSAWVGRDCAFRPRRYLSSDPVPEIRLGSDGEYTEAFREVFTEAVRCRARSAYPVGSALSGGLDSSSIACTARDVLAARTAGPLHTFSAVFPGLPEEERRVADETPFIDSVLSTGGFIPHRVHADRLSPLLDVDTVLWHQDEPVTAYNLYMHWALFGAAREAGVRIFLDGIDGDACVGYGMERLDGLARSGQWDVFEQEVRALHAINGGTHRPVTSYVRSHAVPLLDEMARSGQWRGWARVSRELSGRFGMSRRRLLLQHGIRPGAVDPVTRVLRRLKSAVAPGPTLLNAGFAERVHFNEWARASAAVQSPAIDEREATARRWPDHSVYQYGMEMMDKCAAAFSLEVRFPFFDRRLLTFCLGLPVQQRLSAGWTRVIIRRAMDGVLPTDVQWRPFKQDLSPNFRRGLEEREMGVVQAVIRRDSPIAAYVEPALLDATYQRFVSSPDPRTRTQNAHPLFRAIMLARWLSGEGAPIN
jgi:asparagine synthase (glutamine-hydrolysing)